MQTSRVLGFALGTFCWLLAAPARALTQPGGPTIPTPTLTCGNGAPSGLSAAFACACSQAGVCNIGVPCPDATSCDDGKHGTCESTIWHQFNDNTCIPSKTSGLDPVADASTTPETFRPTCALTFTVLTRGTAIFKNVFGWYNVTGNAPAPSDLHIMLDCNAAPGKSAVLNLASEPDYKGGEVGFFLITPEGKGGEARKCAGGDCCPSVARVQKGEGFVYYSQRTFNPDQHGADSYIHLLTYNSHVVAQKFYFAWEDIFGGSDNEFTDLVTSVDGVQCSGGGVACATGKPGACAKGVTTCSSGSLACAPVRAPQSESCNGIDDDCNGRVDDNATCPVAGDICVSGQCVHGCGTTEFPCDPGTTCDPQSHLCIPDECAGIHCTAGEVCHSGKCAAPCASVKCPHGQTCLGDACVDLCAGKSCGAGQICKDGVCFPGCAGCGGLVCASGTKCDAQSGDCVDPSCTASCAPGTHCSAGGCIDNCADAICPAGQSCTAGQCKGKTGSGNGATSGGVGESPFGGGSQGTNGSDGGPSAGSVQYKQGASGCSVARSDSSSGGSALPMVLAAVGLAARRRRR